MSLLTNSRLKTARQCARLQHLKYELGYRPVEDAAVLAFGTLVHAGLEAWWRAAATASPDFRWLEAAIAALGAVPEVDAFDLVRAEVMLTGYHARWSGDVQQFEVLGVEECFEMALVNPETGGRSTVWRLAGKLDVRLRRLSDGAVGFMEHKTSSEDVSQGSLYWRRLRLDSQVSTYFDGASSLGEPAQWCLYDVLAKPGQRPLKATPEESRKFKKDGTLYAGQRLEDETPEAYRIRLLEAVAEDPSRYFSRGEVVRLEGELAESRFEVWQQAATIRENARAGRHPRNPDACVRGQQVCPFFAVCCGEASLEDPRLFTRTQPVHPELAGFPTSISKEESHNDASNATAADAAAEIHQAVLDPR